MDDKFVTVATFDRSFEAQMAKNLLESEGIPSIVSGDVTADMLPLGQAGGGDQVTLQVNENDAQRAAGILAAVAAAKVDDNWEDEAESGAGVWICSICGEPISNRLSICYSCQTPREGIRAALPRDPTGIQSDLAAVGTDQQVQKRDEIANAPAPRPAVEPAIPAAPQEDETEEPSLTLGDDLAFRALAAALFGIMVGFFLPLAWYLLFLPLSLYFLAKLFFSDQDVSLKGKFYVYATLLANGVCLFYLAYLYVSIHR